MNPFAVEWSEDALDGLADAWLNAADRNAVTQAAWSDPGRSSPSTSHTICSAKRLSGIRSSPRQKDGRPCGIRANSSRPSIGDS